MRSLSVSIKTDAIHEKTTAAVLPRDPKNLVAIWRFLKSPEYASTLRKTYKKVAVATGSMLAVSFDLAEWSDATAEVAQDRLPEPATDDPAQWLFHGHPAFARKGTELHVALARIAGFRWPTETTPDMILSKESRELVARAASLARDTGDGLLMLQGNGRERPLADRMRSILGAAFCSPLTTAQELDLVRTADIAFDGKAARDGSLEGWLRDRAFRQHCILFHHRPFLWHVWDGLPDGFSVFVGYHKLTHGTLEKLIFTMLGDWISKARAESRTAHESRALQLQQHLRGILEGETPLDIFVRWKASEHQPLGWQPDLDDGVRLNIRPFMSSGVLREQPSINWGKDRGADSPSTPWYHLGPQYDKKNGKKGDRINDHHLTLAEKRVARGKAP
jgi:hypothetical protein